MLKLILFLLLKNAFASIELSAPREKGWSEIEETIEYWKDLGNLELDKAKSVKHRNHRAKNVIFFMGDGMGIQEKSITRLYFLVIHEI